MNERLNLYKHEKSILLQRHDDFVNVNSSGTIRHNACKFLIKNMRHAKLLTIDCELDGKFEDNYFLMS